MGFLVPVSKAAPKQTFRSSAQQRFMYAQHPDIASRWTRRAKRRNKGAEHPIKALNLPERVGKASPFRTRGSDGKFASNKPGFKAVSVELRGGGSGAAGDPKERSKSVGRRLR